MRSLRLQLTAIDCEFDFDSHEWSCSQMAEAWRNVFKRVRCGTNSCTCPSSLVVAYVRIA